MIELRPTNLHRCGIYAADFETTVDEDITTQTHTEVWATALLNIKDDEPTISTSISDFFRDCRAIPDENTERFDTSKITDKSEKELLDSIGIVDIFFHNFKFDGSFILSWLIKNGFECNFDEDWFYTDKTMNYLITDKNQWYYLCVRWGKRIFIFKDSFKLIPVSIKKAAKDFGLTITKGEIDYKGDRHENGELTEQEKDYIARDVKILRDCLYIFMREIDGVGLTIASTCLKEFKRTMYYSEFKAKFPDLNYSDDDVPDETYDALIRKSYRGGWCYCVDGKENTDISSIQHYDEFINRLLNKQLKTQTSITNLEYVKYDYSNLGFNKKSGHYTHGCTLDVNSLYPSCMLDHEVPVGKPIRVEHDLDLSGKTLKEYTDEWELSRLLHKEYYFVEIECRFEIKDGYLPFIQLKNTRNYKSNKMLTTSNPIDIKTGKELKERVVINEDGSPSVVPYKVNLVLTCADLRLFVEHYNVYDYKITKKIVFNSCFGIFDDYIEKWKNEKIKATVKKNKALRTIAKLFLNSLYGKFGGNPIRYKSIARLDEDGILRFTVDETPSELAWGYVPVAAAITSWARNFTIRTAQKFYFGVNKRGFIYADTDSLHVDLTKEEVLKIAETYNVKIHDSNFSCWKLESEWEQARFIRQKTYIEGVLNNGLLEFTEDSIKCAGMGKRCVELFTVSLNIDKYREIICERCVVLYIADKELNLNYVLDENNDIKHIVLNYDELCFMKGLYNEKKPCDLSFEEVIEYPYFMRTIENFDINLQIPSNLKNTQIEGGVLLKEFPYILRG